MEEIEIEIEIVLESLVRGEKEGQIEAAIELSNLSKKQKQQISDKDLIISSLLSMLQSQDSLTTQAALSALLSLAFGSERNKVWIVRSGVVPILIEILESEREMVIIEMAMAFLLILSSSNKNKLKIASSSSSRLIQVLVRLIGFVDSITIQAKIDGVATLHNLSTHKQIVPLIISSGGPYALLQIINFTDKSSELSEKATALLENIAYESPESISSINGAIRVLVEVIEEGAGECKENAVGILLGVCKYDRERNRGLILREGVMPGLLQVSVDGTERGKEMARELLLLLRRDCCSGFDMKHSKIEIVQQIMQEIDQDGERIPEVMLKLVQDLISKLTT